MEYQLTIIYTAIFLLILMKELYCLRALKKNFQKYGNWLNRTNLSGL